jgi:hypothetical protein
MTDTTRDQLLKSATGAMVNVDMNPTSSKIIGKEVCLRSKGLFGLSRDLGPERCPKTLWKEESKEIINFMKVENGGVHHERYNGHCKKQQVIIPKTT